MQKYIVKINSPCNQDWSQIKVNQAGRFCELCSKNVVDFTSYSDSRLQETLLKSDNSICGKLKASQLNRALNSQKATNKLSRLISVLTGLTFMIASKEGLANDNTERIHIDSSFTNQPSFKSELELHRDSMQYHISGVVYEAETNKTLQGATITIKGNNYGISTRSDGTFNLNIPESLLKKELTIVVSFVGFKTQEFVINNQMLPLKKNIYLELSDDVLGGLVIIREKKWWQR